MNEKKSPVEIHSQIAEGLPRMPYFATMDIPAGLGVLASEQQKLLARWMMHQSQSNGSPQPEVAPVPDHLLTPEQAAQIMGVEISWLYAHSKKLPFTRKLGRKMLRFSETGLRKWVASKKGGV